MKYGYTCDFFVGVTMVKKVFDSNEDLTIEQIKNKLCERYGSAVRDLTVIKEQWSKDE